ncbi:hypothetical protein SAMN05216266_13715 [Amycolatopsis marina]|uniref:Uncharacterized protein n=1 Tax=Amycolatopsis marina TaxID=490629 RepID=A0A1I1CM84_9PSEU|nr:hypothetical protein [Amycolatopsis marina]SFB63771.1 hypothetical protein SAMN05216266_13715 [Amycolatopsis marina]
MTSKTADTWQGVFGLIGITLGVIPLGMLVFGSSNGLWTLVLDDSAGALRWVLPLVVLVVGVLAIGVLERYKR